MFTTFSVPRTWGAAALAGLMTLAMLGSAQAAPDDDAVDPPSRVARLSYLGGEVSFQPAGDKDWVQASLNRPLVTGDSLYTDRNARTELQMGGAAVRLDDRSSINVLNLNDQIAQFELSEGVLRLSVRNLGRDQSYEIDTPTLAFVTTMPGEYRIDVAPDGRSTMVTVFDGSGDVYGEQNASYSVRAGNTYRFNDSSLRDYEVLDLPRADDFDNWVASRERQYERSVSRRYVSDDMIGYSDLDEYGSWNTVADYGAVWYPTSVAVGWAPYRSGHWSWIGAWGWTWVDTAPWGFAPFHYGRWIYAGNRWGWCPGPRHFRPIYAPAMVAFVGGNSWSANIRLGGGPVGWFPLGPRDVYVPWYHTSRRYFTDINVHNTTIINNVHITNIYNDYSQGRPVPGNNYMWRNNSAAMTAVSRETFVGARPVLAGRVNINAAQWNSAPVATRLGIAPTQASFAAADARRASAVPQAAVLDRRVIARTAPAPTVAPIAERVQAIERNQGRPLSRPLPAATPERGEATAQRGIPSRIQVVDNPAARPQAITRTPAGAEVERRGNAPIGESRPTQRIGSETEVQRNNGRGMVESERAPPSSRFAPQRSGGNEGTPSRGSIDSSSRVPQRVGGEAEVQRNNGRGAIESERALPSSRFAPQRNGGNEGMPARSNEGSTIRTPQRESAPSQSSRNIEAVQPQRESSSPTFRSRNTESVQPQRESSSPSFRSRSVESAPVQRESASPSYRSRSMESAPPQRSYESAPPQRAYQPAPQRESAPPSYSRSVESAPPQRSYQSAPPQRAYESAPVQRAPQPQPMQQPRMEAPQRQASPPPAREAAPARRESKRDSDDGDRGVSRR